MTAEDANVQRDDEGYLIHLEGWTSELAVSLAREEDLTLTEEHRVSRGGRRHAAAADRRRDDRRAAEPTIGFVDPFIPNPNLSGRGARR